MRTAVLLCGALGLVPAAVLAQPADEVLERERQLSGGLDERDRQAGSRRAPTPPAPQRRRDAAGRHHELRTMGTLAGLLLGLPISRRRRPA